MSARLSVVDGLLAFALGVGPQPRPAACVHHIVNAIVKFVGLVQEVHVVLECRGASGGHIIIDV